MKKLFLLVTVAVALVAGLNEANAATFTNKNVSLEFDYPALDLTPDLAVYVYTNSSLLVPVSNWQVAAVVTNVAAANKIPIVLHLPRSYFVLQASNVWGLSDFSEVASAVPPRSDIKPKLSR